jgi:transcriptional regulator GlxA family with amidase domain
VARWPNSARPLDEVVDYIQAHPERPLGVAELAAVAGTPAARLRAAFMKELGTTPTRYVRGVRLDRAHAELSAGRAPAGSLSAVARRWGFGDVPRFRAAYAARYGQDPAVVLGQA